MPTKSKAKQPVKSKVKIPSKAVRGGPRVRRVNEFVSGFGIEIADRIPKRIWAAIAISLTLEHTKGDLEKTRELILGRWMSLFESGRILQKPGKWARVGATSVSVEKAESPL